LSDAIDTTKVEGEGSEDPELLLLLLLPAVEPELTLPPALTPDGMGGCSHCCSTALLLLLL
jgi:hypothetical protein